MNALRLAAFGLLLSLNSAIAGTQLPLHPMVVILPIGHINKLYPATTLLSGGTPPYTGKVDGTLPKGMSVGGAGILFGTPREAGTFHFKLDTTDSVGATLELSYALQISR